LTVHAFTGTCFSGGQVTSAILLFLETLFTPHMPGEIAQGRDKYRKLCSVSASIYLIFLTNDLFFLAREIMIVCLTSSPKVFLYQMLNFLKKFTRKLIFFFFFLLFFHLFLFYHLNIIFPEISICGSDFSYPLG